MPHRNSKGYWRIKRSFGFVNGVEIGQLNISLGTPKEKEAVKYETAICALAELGRSDLLLALKNGERNPREIFELVTLQQIHSIHHVTLGEVSLREALSEWLPNAVTKSGRPLSNTSKESYRKIIKHILKPTFSSADAKVRDLPMIYSFLQRHYAAKEKHRIINKVKAMCLAFARTTQPKGKHSELYTAISALPGAPNKRKRDRRGQAVWQILEMLQKMPQPWRNIAYFMVLTGCHGLEYNNGFEIQDDRIIIKGSKNANRRNRPVPRIADDFVQEHLPKDYRPLNKAIKKASGQDITHYDLRATYALWLEEAGIPDFRRKWYMGWTTRTVSDGYKDVAEFLRAKFLRDDAERLIKYIADNKQKPDETSKRTTPLLSISSLLQHNQGNSLPYAPTHTGNAA